MERSELEKALQELLLSSFAGPLQASNATPRGRLRYELKGVTLMIEHVTVEIPEDGSE